MQSDRKPQEARTAAKTGQLCRRFPTSIFQRKLEEQVNFTDYSDCDGDT
jgi:hypothetical protein